MNRSDANKKGAATYQQWYPSVKNYKGTIGNGITWKISVVSTPAGYTDPSEISDFDDGIPVNNTADFHGHTVEEDVTDTPEDDVGDAKTVNQIIKYATIVNQYGGKNIHIDHVDTLNL